MTFAIMTLLIIAFRIVMVIGVDLLLWIIAVIAWEEIPGILTAVRIEMENGGGQQ